jgi:hypothetical protein
MLYIRYECLQAKKEKKIYILDRLVKFQKHIISYLKLMETQKKYT